MANPQERRKREQQEADAEFHAGMVIAGRSALEREAHAEYNSQVNRAARLVSEAEGLDGDPNQFLTPGEAQDMEALRLKAAFFAAAQEDDGEDVEPEPRADGLDVVHEGVQDGSAVENPVLTQPFVDAGSSGGGNASNQGDAGKSAGGARAERNAGETASGNVSKSNSASARTSKKS